MGRTWPLFFWVKRNHRRFTVIPQCLWKTLWTFGLFRVWVRQVFFKGKATTWKMPAVPSRVELFMSVWDLGDVFGMQTSLTFLRTFSHPVCSPWNWYKSMLRAFQSWQDQLQPCTSWADTEQDKGAQWTWECSGCKCTTAFLLQLCKNFLFLSLVLLGVLQLFPPPLNFLHSKLLLFTFSLTL